MGMFKIFSRSKVDEEILELYFDIEVIIEEINLKFNDYFRYLNNCKYYASNFKTKKFYSIQQVYSFFIKLRQDYGYCYTLRENRKYYQFGKSAQARAEKLEILIELKKIIKILRLIHSYVKELDKTHIKENSFKELVNLLQKFIKTEQAFKKIKEKDEQDIMVIIRDIVTESIENEKHGIWLISQKDKKKRLHFSQKFSISRIKELELVPLLQLDGLRSHGALINPLHKDSTLPVYHYNLIVDRKNIHVVPNQFNTKIIPFLSGS